MSNDEKLMEMIRNLEEAKQLLPEDQREVKGPQLKFMRDIILDTNYIAMKESVEQDQVAHYRRSNASSQRKGAGRQAEV